MHHQQQRSPKELGLLGNLCPGDRRLDGKTFYLDNVKKRQTVLLLEAISLHGGRIESFLHKDVNFVVTGSQEALKEKRTDARGGGKTTNDEARNHTKQPDSVLSSEKRQQQPATPRPQICGSRGKALLEKAIRNNERLQGSSVLASARSWGVKILYVEDVLLYLKQVSRESSNTRQKRPEKTNSHPQSSPVKAAALRSPYLKIEDTSKKYKPLHMQSMTFPSLCYLGRFSPFESPPPPRFEKPKEEKEASKREKKDVESSINDKSQTPLICNPWRTRKKDTSYCECCHQAFTSLEEHLQSEQHRAFVLDQSNYGVIDQLVAEMVPGFDPDPSEHVEDLLSGPPTLIPIQDVCELEPLTDGETEQAVLALRRQSSSINTPTETPLCFGPANPAVEDQCSISNLPLPLDDLKLPDIELRSSSPMMPVLDIELPATSSVCKVLSQHTTLDPYILPPVLSPQIPNTCCTEYVDNPYLEPPVLSPQPLTAEQTVVRVCEMDTAEDWCEPISDVSVQLHSSAADTEVGGSKQGGFLSSCAGRGKVNDSDTSHRSQPLPQQVATRPNPKKRCRSASPDFIYNKKRRVGMKRDEFVCTHQESKAPERDTRTKYWTWTLLEDASHKSAESHLRQNSTSQPNLTFLCSPFAQPVDISAPGHMFVTLSPSKTLKMCPPVKTTNEKCLSGVSSQDSQRSQSLSTSVCIDSALIPDVDALSGASSESDWDCNLLSRLGTTSAFRLSATEQGCELDKELLLQPCTWLHDTSYESRLHNALEPSNPLCGEEMDSAVFSRAVMQIVEVQH